MFGHKGTTVCLRGGGGHRGEHRSVSEITIGLKKMNRVQRLVMPRISATSYDAWSDAMRL